VNLRDTATILRATAGTGGYAGEEPESDWTTPTETDVPCSIQPGSSREADQDRPDFVVADWVGYFPAGTDLTNADRVRWRGRTFTVDGEVGLWVHGASEHHLEAPLKRVG